MIEVYLRTLEGSLHLASEETREILMEVRGSLRDAALQLESEGMSPSEAEREAVACFGNPRVLAMALRRAHGCFPLPLRVLSVALLAFGTAGLVLDALIAPAYVENALHSTIFDAWMIIAITAIQVGAAALSFAVGAIGIWKGRRGRVGPAIRVWLWLGLVVDIVLMMILWSSLLPNNLRAQPSTVGNSDVSIDIPNLALLKAAGRIGRPGSEQLGNPVRVEYVAVDSGTTYVQYAIREPGHEVQVFPRLHDARGREYPLRSAVVTFSVTGGLYGLLPWAWAAQPRGVAIFDAVPANTTALTLDFYSVEGARKPGFGVWDPYFFLTYHLYDTPAATLSHRSGPYVVPAHLETVRLPLHLRALSTIRTAHPRQVVSLKAFGVSVDSVTNSAVDAQIVYSITSPPGAQVGNPGYPDMSDQRGRSVAFALRIDDSFHGQTAITPPGYSFYPLQTPLADGKVHYQSAVVLPPQRPGTRLLLSFSGFSPAGTALWIQGPWRLWMTMP